MVQKIHGITVITHQGVKQYYADDELEITLGEYYIQDRPDYIEARPCYVVTNKVTNKIVADIRCLQNIVIDYE